MSVRSDSGCFCGFHIVFHVAHIGVKHVDCCAPQQSWLGSFVVNFMSRRLQSEANDSTYHNMHDGRRLFRYAE